MSFPYINWYQDDNHIYINILNIIGNSIVNIKNNFLEYSDSKYYFNLELFNSFTLSKHYIKRNNYFIILNKTEDLSIWNYLLKEKDKYKYFISLNWDKYNTYLKLKKQECPLDDNNYNEEEFQKLMETGVLDQISSDED